MLAISGLNITHKKGYATRLCAEETGLLDDLCSLHEHVRGDSEAKLPGGLEVDHEVELARLLDGGVGRVSAF